MAKLLFDFVIIIDKCANGLIGIMKIIFAILFAILFISLLHPVDAAKTAPSQVTGLSATTISPTQIDLSYSAPSNGGSFSYKFAKAGTFDYYCMVNA